MELPEMEPIELINTIGSDIELARTQMDFGSKDGEVQRLLASAFELIEEIVEIINDQD